MKTELLLESVGLIDDKYVEEFVRCDLTAKKRLRTKRICSAIAACLCVAVIAGAAWRVFEPAIWPYTPTGEPWRPKFGSFVEEITLDASQLPSAPITSSIKGDAETSMYNIVNAPSLEYLGLAPIPETDYLPIYQVGTSEDKLFDAKRFVKTYRNAATELLGIDCSDCKAESVDGTTVLDGDAGVRFLTSGGNVNRFYYFNDTLQDSDTPWIELNGKVVMLNQIYTDEQIKAGLSDAIADIGRILDMELTQFEIVREYDVFYLKKLTVYLYETEKNAFPAHFKKHPMASKYVELTFCPYDGRLGLYPGFSETATGEMYLQGFAFYETDESWSDYYQVIGKSRMISPDEAVALLASGYELHSDCHICDELIREYQKPIDFTDYDAVELIYLSKNGMYVPFYAFYKYHSNALFDPNKEPLLINYAVTYVPAVEVENIETFFD